MAGSFYNDSKARATGDIAFFCSLAVTVVAIVFMLCYVSHQQTQVKLACVQAHMLYQDGSCVVLSLPPASSSSSSPPINTKDKSP